MIDRLNYTCLRDGQEEWLSLGTDLINQANVRKLVRYDILDQVPTNSADSDKTIPLGSLL